MRTFYEVLKRKTREFWINEEVVASERYGLKRMSPQNFFQLVNLGKKEQNGRLTTLQGVHNYDILSNQIYQDKLLYVPCVYPQRSQYVISQFKQNNLRTQSTDYVRLSCDLAYLPETKARELDMKSFDSVAYHNSPALV